MFAAKDWVFLHHSTLVHWALLVQQHITKHDTMVPLPTAVLSLLTPCNYLFLWMKNWLNVCHLKTAADVRVALEIELQEVSCGGFQKCFKQLYKCWQKRVGTEGECFEGKCILGLLSGTGFEIRFISWKFLKLPCKSVSCHSDDHRIQQMN
jgi:hypothetical protein